jgi:hypothetical protein
MPDDSLIEAFGLPNDEIRSRTSCVFAEASVCFRGDNNTAPYHGYLLAEIVTWLARELAVPEVARGMSTDRKISS